MVEVGTEEAVEGRRTVAETEDDRENENMNQVTGGEEGLMHAGRMIQEVEIEIEVKVKVKAVCWLWAASGGGTRL
jgi:hypothetical protein